MGWPFFDSEKLYTAPKGFVVIFDSPITCLSSHTGSAKYDCFMFRAERPTRDGRRDYYCVRHQEYSYEWPVKNVLTYKNGETFVLFDKETD